ncbi:hypothetical protein GCK72_025893 [Caenorhabditis remanei]|nr:hypothetical protein GCK72_025893 [Caenorhabditis remanei]KAF1749425.1 hypothetical protein GCK72_025893 [Caenorhabditis remanei]
MCVESMDAVLDDYFEKIRLSSLKVTNFLCVNVGDHDFQQALESTQGFIDVLNEDYECPEYGVLPQLEGDDSKKKNNKKVSL